MQLTPRILSELQKRLKIGNRRGVHLNAIPSKSRYKFDLHRLSHIDESLPNAFIEALLTQLPLKFPVSWKTTSKGVNSLLETDQAQLVNISKSFENLINQTEAIESEKGINTFGFGFPILVRRDQLDKKLTAAPILIWSLRIKRSQKEFNTWEILRSEDDPVYLNEVLINHLYNDSKVVIPPIPSEMLDDGLISKDELVDLCANLLKEVHFMGEMTSPSTLREQLSSIKSIEEKAHYEKALGDSINGFIDFGGVFSIFEVQKQNIIEDYERLMNIENLNLDLEDLDNHHFQSISSVQTDPSQQGILHALERKRNILIQGPPGTGKSQTLTAILINALENHKKTLVVCEKRTALDVLHNALIEKNLGNNCVLIRDIVKDRRAVIESVRGRVDNSSYKRNNYYYSKEPLNEIIEKAKSLIDIINRRHQKLDKKLLGEKNWTSIVGELLAQLNNEEHLQPTQIQDWNFSYTSKELNELLEAVNEGDVLYSAYKPCIDFTFLNPNIFLVDNPYQLEKELKTAFHQIELDLNEIEKLSTNRTWWQKFFYPKLQRSINELKNRVNSNNLSNKVIESTKYEDITAEIKLLLAQSKSYFEKNHVFIAEYNWLSYYKNLDAHTTKIVDDLKGKENWRRLVLIKYLQSTLTHFADSQLPTADTELVELGKTVGGLEEAQIDFIRHSWFSKQMSATSSFGIRHNGLSVENLYNKRSSPKHKRSSLRQIVQYDIDLFTTFFPIILTSPDVASNLFSGRNGYFDIIMFDEASQLRIEDNLPAILKGKQRIIAGDEHQMPPSNYFSKVFDGTLDDEDELDEEETFTIDRNNLLLSSESLLDFGMELNFEKRYLDFHYRSRHPYLIDFSNYAFYNQRLKPLPNSFDYIPIKYVQVNGTFSEHINEAEAEKVLSILEHNIHRLPNGEYPSVGIATFNITQRNFIISKILERQKFDKYAAFNDKITELEQNGLFIKNLENIQGDERDVIIISTTYGIGKDGKFAQRFGPINHSKGYKLLNVIVTRAKYKVYICSSIPENVFSNFRNELSLEGSNNRRAVFYAYLSYCKAVSESNTESREAVLHALSENSGRINNIDYDTMGKLESPFEEEVYERLIDNVDKDNLYLQMKVSEFRIDMVYDSKKPGIPKIAIECDGAKYHSSREAYLHDKHRQQILEKHGFVFHRIWSTNWWRNPQFETKRLVEFIQSVESRTDHRMPDYTQIASAFGDHFVSMDSIVTKASGLDHDTEQANIEVISNYQEPNQDITISKVRVESKVLLHYLNEDKKIKVHIVEYANKTKSTSGIQQIGKDSPLALSLLGHSTGDITKVGNLDNFVQILEIIDK